MLGQDRPEKNSGKCLIRSGDITSARQASVDKTNDSVMNYERGALVRGSDPPSGHKCSQHGRCHHTWQAPARRLIQKLLSTGV